VHHVGSFVWSIHDARSEKHQVTLIVSLIANCCGQFEVLHYSLRTIKERAEEFVVKEMVSVDRSHNAKKKVSRHKKDVKFKKKKTGYTTGKLRKAHECHVTKQGA